MLPAFRARHPRVEVEVVAENRFVDIVAEGYDAGIRLHEALERAQGALRQEGTTGAEAAACPIFAAQRLARTAPWT